MNQFLVYRTFLSLKYHFTIDSYDIKKYGLNSSKFTLESLNKKNDRYFYKVLAKKFNYKDELIQFLAINLLINSDIWIEDLIFNEIADQNYANFSSYLMSLEHYFLNDIKHILNNGGLVNTINCDNNELPKIILMMFKKEIHPATIIILDRLMNVLHCINQKISNHILWDKVYHKLTKFQMFVKIESVEQLTILSNKTKQLLTKKE